jgi:hypothetical protein
MRRDVIALTTEQQRATRAGWLLRLVLCERQVDIAADYWAIGDSGPSLHPLPARN